MTRQVPAEEKHLSCTLLIVGMQYPERMHVFFYIWVPIWDQLVNRKALL